MNNFVQLIPGLIEFVGCALLLPFIIPTSFKPFDWVAVSGAALDIYSMGRALFGG